MSLRKGRGHEKWAVKRGRVMQIYARDHVEVHPQSRNRGKAKPVQENNINENTFFNQNFISKIYLAEDLNSLNENTEMYPNESKIWP